MHSREKSKEVCQYHDYHEAATHLDQLTTWHGTMLLINRWQSRKYDSVVIIMSHKYGECLIDYDAAYNDRNSRIHDEIEGVELREESHYHAILHS